MAGSNVLIGQQGGQNDFLATGGYRRQGLPGDMVPGLTDPILQLPYANFDLGLGFHLDSAFRRGIMASLQLGGSENTDSGGNSMLPLALYDPEFRPTKVDRPSDVVNLIDTGELVGILSKNDATAVMESIYRLTDSKMGQVNTQVTNDAVIKELVRCGYVKAADIADRLGGVAIDPGDDDMIVDLPTSTLPGIFSQAEFNDGGRDGSEFRKTASVMKLVLNGYAGAGCIEMGGYDYHGGQRQEGEPKDFRAGRCMGAVLEYAARLQTPVMIYVFSDGSLSSNGAIDNSIEGRGKGEWDSDNSSVGAAFFLVYNPGRRPTIIGATPAEVAAHQQLGYMSSDGAVNRAGTPAANNVNLLVNTVLLNYMALHGEQAQFNNLFPNHGLGNSIMQDSLTAFTPIVNGTTAFPV